MSTTTVVTPNQDSVNTAANTQRKLDAKAAIAIINKRDTYRLSDAGLLKQFFIQGTPQFLAKGHKYTANGVDRENGFDRTIYNIRANSAVAMAAHKELFSEAMKAESAGDTDKAHDLFNEYLNKIQISFSIIATGRERRFQNGDLVKGVIDTAVNAAGETAIVVNDVSAVAVVPTTKVTFSVEDLLAV